MNAAGRMLLTQAMALLGVALVTTGLYLWGGADVWAQKAQRVDAAAWSGRCLAAALVAGGQVIFALGVVPAFFGRGRLPTSRGLGTLEQGFALAMGLLLLLSLVAGGALAAAAGW